MKLPFNFSETNAKDALRLALQSALAAAITYIVLHAAKLPEVFVGVLSAVLVVEPSIGNTYNSAKGRLISTLVGTLIGFTLLIIIPWGFGTAISLAIAMFVLNGIASYKPNWRYGVVAAVAIALGSEANAWEASLDRIIAIGIGISIGIVISFIVFPKKTEALAKRHLKKALHNTYDFLENSINGTRSKEDFSTQEANKFHENLSTAKTFATSIAFNDKDSYLQQIEQTEKLFNSILIIHRVALNTKGRVTDGDSGIEKNTEALKECALTAIEELSNDASSADTISKLSEHVSKVKNNFKNSESNKDINMLRNTFVFGITEIEDSIKKLHELKS